MKGNVNLCIYCPSFSFIGPKHWRNGIPTGILHWPCVVLPHLLPRRRWSFWKPKISPRSLPFVTGLLVGMIGSDEGQFPSVWCILYWGHVAPPVPVRLFLLFVPALIRVEWCLSRDAICVCKVNTCRLWPDTWPLGVKVKREGWGAIFVHAKGRRPRVAILSITMGFTSGSTPCYLLFQLEVELITDLSANNNMVCPLFLFSSSSGSPEIFPGHYLRSVRPEDIWLLYIPWDYFGTPVVVLPVGIHDWLLPGCSQCLWYSLYLLAPGWYFSYLGLPAPLELTLTLTYYWGEGESSLINYGEVSSTVTGGY